MKKTKMPTMLLTFIMSFQVMSVYAAAPDALLTLIIDIIGKGMIALAVVFAVMGVSKWAAAHSDGDGPEMKKAVNTLAAAIILVVISAVLVASKATLASALTT